MIKPIFVCLPGASLMDIEAVAEGLRVSCPGCGAVQVFAAVAGEVRSAAFVHENRCAILARIDKILDEIRRTVERAVAASTN